MELGVIGLGRTGANMARRLIEGGHKCVVFDVSPKAVKFRFKPGCVTEVAKELLSKNQN